MEGGITEVRSTLPGIRRRTCVRVTVQVRKGERQGRQILLEGELTCRTDDARSKEMSL